MSSANLLIRTTLAVLLLALSVGAHAVDEAEVVKLEQQCEAAREAKIAPLREAEIAKCKADKHEDPAYCDRYWRDNGNPVRRPDGSMKPRLFHDIPECTVSWKAREDFRKGN
jgi:hypothetical protein